MRPALPEDTVFRRLMLDVESDSSEHFGATLHVCDHRIHTVHSPVELHCRLVRCSDCLCPIRCQTSAPPASCLSPCPGTARDPKQLAIPSPNRATGRLMRDFAGLRDMLRFGPERLRAVAVIERRQ
jgi:hypothetical protein